MIAQPWRIRVLTRCCCVALVLACSAIGQIDRDGDSQSDPTLDRIASRGGEVSEQLEVVDHEGLRAAYETARHAIYSSGDTFEARNSEQRLTIRFDGRGVGVRPDTDDWTWGLELERYGFAGGETDTTDPVRVRVNGGRVHYEWSAALEEWFVNDRRGLEHGYTVRQRPPRGAGGGAGALTFTLRVRGGLRPEVTAGGRDVRFLDDGGTVALLYAGLCVFDADGRELVASFVGAGDRLHLHLDERGARYPLTIDPIVQQAYLKASNTESGDWFGRSVAVSGNTAVVGAYQEDSAATGVNGNQRDNSAPRSGAAYVFVRNGVAWSQQAYLKASNTDTDDFFGSSVAISGDTVVIGAPHESSSATGVDGDGNDNGSMWSGAAYVFVRNGQSWSQQAYLKACNTSFDDLFGYSVGVSGDTVVVGALGEDSGATGVGGDPGDDSASFSGAVYVFVRIGATWHQEAYLKASNTDVSDAFGHCVAVSGDAIVSGAYKEASNATGVNGDQDDNSAVDAGAVYVFRKNGSAWSQEAYLKASNTGAADKFGWSVAVSGDTVVVGADREDSGASGIDGDQVDNGAPGAGAAYVFVRGATGWVQTAYLKASNTDEDDHFGQAVAISGDTVVVGASGEDSASVGVNGNESDDESSFAGASYVYGRVGTDWSQRAYLKASNTDPLDGFGRGVAVSNDTVLVASLDKSAATGVNGNQADNSAPDAGAVYAFDLDADLPGTGFCFGDQGSGTPCPCHNRNDGSVPGSGCANGVFISGAQLKGSGFASVSVDSLVLTTTGMEPNNSGLYFQGNNDLSPGVAWGDGLRCVGGELKRLQVRFANTTGTSFTTVRISTKAGNVTAGSTKRYQCWYRTNLDPPCGSGVNDFNSSNGYAVTWGP